MRKEIRVALAGNPNSGKTTLFNAITGSRHKVGNYPGVTVEKREGVARRNGRDYRFVDLPGVYSLTAYSMDEVVTRDFLLDERPDLIVDVLDSTNLERHLYLCLQFQELGIPVIGALNMTDEAAAKGIEIDAAALSDVLGLPFVATVGTRGEGLDALYAAIDALMPGGVSGGSAGSAPPGARETAVVEPRSVSYGPEIESRLAALERAIAADAEFSSRYRARWLAVKLLEKDPDARARLETHRDGTSIAALADESVAWIERHYGRDCEIVVSEQRYGYIRGAAKEALKTVGKPDFPLSEAIDRIVMHPVLALPIFFLVLWGVFQATFALGALPTAWMEAGFSWLAGAVGPLIADGTLRSLLVDGIIGGVGGVLSFVPPVIALFFLLSLLEDSGYMSRAAFATDRFLHSVGLHGQSALPMILGFGCSVPAIMAARALKSPRDRIKTVLVIPLMSCGAKLPVYVLLAGAFFPGDSGAAVMAIYAIGVVLALVSSFVLGRTVLKGKPTPFVMELPPWRAPTLKGVLWHVRDKTWQYAKKAGTVILAASLLIWAVTTFPRAEPTAAERDEMRSAIVAAKPGADDGEVAAALEAATGEYRMEHSFAGLAGKFMEPAFAPLGLDWKSGVAVLTGFAAKEVIVSTLGILHGAGDEGLADALVRDPGFTPLVAFVLMLLTLVIPPCFAALATIRAEIGGKWLAFSVVWLVIMGWSLAFAARTIGVALGF